MKSLITVLNKISKNNFNNFYKNLSLLPFLCGKNASQESLFAGLYTIAQFVERGQSAITRHAGLDIPTISKELSRAAAPKDGLTYMQKLAILTAIADEKEQEGEDGGVATMKTGDTIADMLYPTEVFARLESTPIVSEKDYKKLVDTYGRTNKAVENIAPYVGMSKRDFFDELVNSPDFHLNSASLYAVVNNPDYMKMLGGKPYGDDIREWGDASSLAYALIALSLDKFKLDNPDSGKDIVEANNGNIINSVERFVNSRNNTSLLHYIRKLQKQWKQEVTNNKRTIYGADGEELTPSDFEMGLQALDMIEEDSKKHPYATDKDFDPEANLKIEEYRKSLERFEEILKEKEKGSILYSPLLEKLEQAKKMINDLGGKEYYPDIPRELQMEELSFSAVKAKFDEFVEKSHVKDEAGKLQDAVVETKDWLEGVYKEQREKIGQYASDKGLSDDEAKNLELLSLGANISLLNAINRMGSNNGATRYNHDKKDKTNERAYMHRAVDSDKRRNYIPRFEGVFPQLSPEEQQKLVDEYMSTGFTTYLNNFYKDNGALKNKDYAAGVSEDEEALIKQPSEGEALSRIQNAIKDKFISASPIGNAGFTPVELDFLRWAVNNFGNSKLTKDKVGPDYEPLPTKSTVFTTLQKELDDIHQLISDYSNDNFQKTMDRQTAQELRKKLDTIEKALNGEEKNLDKIDKEITRLEKMMNKTQDPKLRSDLEKQLKDEQDKRVVAFDENNEVRKKLKAERAKLDQKLIEIVERSKADATPKEQAQNAAGFKFDFTTRKTHPDYGDVVYDQNLGNWFKVAKDGRSVYRRPLDIQEDQVQDKVEEKIVKNKKSVETGASVDSLIFKTASSLVFKTAAGTDTYTSDENAAAIKNNKINESVEDRFVEVQGPEKKTFNASQLADILSNMKHNAPELWEETKATLNSQLAGDDQQFYKFVLNLEKNNFSNLDQAAQETNTEFGIEQDAKYYKRGLEGRVAEILENVAGFEEAKNNVLNPGNM